MSFVFPRLTILLFLCSLTQASIAGEQTLIESKSIPSAVKAPLASKSLLLDITKVGLSKLVAVGERGHIIVSADAINWQQADVPLQVTLTNVFFIDESLGWAVGHDATILHTKNGGTTWEIQQYLPKLEKPLLDVVFKTPTDGIAIGAYGLFFRTEDGGVTWKKEFHDEFLQPEDAEYLNELKQEDEEAFIDESASILPHFNRLELDGRTLFLVGEIGLIAKSNDFGLSWETFEEIYNGSFFDISRTRKGNLLIVGLRGHVFRSLKNGMPWEQSQTKTTALINDIVLADDERIFLLANSGVLLISDDDGQSYQLRTQRDGKALIAGVWFKNQLVVVSDVGVKIISL